MNDTEPGFEADDETRRLLAAADPARSLPPAGADALASLLEDTMSQPTNQPPVGAGSARRGPSRLLLVGGIAAASVVAAVAVVVATHGGDGTTKAPSAAKTASTTVTRLQVGAGAGKCMAPTAALVATQPLAFEGTVTSVKDGVVTLGASRFYVGAPTEVVTVTESDPGNSESVNFHAGDDYIVAAKDGQVSMCLSGLATDELRSAYAQAFGQ